MDDSGLGDDKAFRGKVLDLLDQGKIDARQAVELLGTVEGEPASESRADPTKVSPGLTPPRWWRWWWAALVGGGIGVIVIGAGFGTLGGWWWLCGGPAILAGLVLLVIGTASLGSPWLRLRIETGSQSWPRRINVSLPLPLRPVAWLLRRLAWLSPRLRATAVDELLMALDGEISANTPLVVDVHEGEGGERVRVYIG